MSTTVIRCPECGEMLRVAVQPATIRVKPEWEALKVTFDDQTVAHKCKEPK